MRTRKPESWQDEKWAAGEKFPKAGQTEDGFCGSIE